MPRALRAALATGGLAVLLGCGGLLGGPAGLAEGDLRAIEALARDNDLEYVHQAATLFRQGLENGTVTAAEVNAYRAALDAAVADGEFGADEDEGLARLADEFLAE